MTTELETAQNGEYVTAHSAGALLREARDSLGLSAADVARGLRIRLVYVQGIEDDNYSVLPGKAYVLGFLRSYAEFLGLDGDDIVTRYRRQLDDGGLPQTTLNFPVREPETRLPRGAILLLSVVLAAGAVYGGARYLDDEAVQTVDRVAPVPDRLIAETRPAPTPGLTPRSDPSSAFAAVTPQPSEAGAGSSVLTQPSPALTAAPRPDATPGAPAAESAITAPATPVDTAPAAAVPPPAVADATQASPPVASAGAPPARSPVTTQAKPPRPEAAARVETPKPETTRPEPPKPDTARTETGRSATPAAPPTAAKPPPPADATQSAALPAPPKPRDVVVVARVDSWIEVRDSNNSPLVSLLLRVGDSYRVPEGANYRLVTGDVRGLEVRVDGVAVRQRGVDDNKPHRTLSLDGERLVNGSAVID